MRLNQTRARYYRILFLIGGIWNIGASLGLEMLVLLDSSAWELFGMAVPPSLFFFHMMMGFIFILGIGYIVISGNINENRALAILGGVVGRLMVFGGSAITVSLGQAKPILLVLTTIDLLLAILAIGLLYSVRKVK